MQFVNTNDQTLQLQDLLRERDGNIRLVEAEAGGEDLGRVGFA